MTELINRHKAINAENRQLIEMHLEYSETFLNLMVDSEDPLNNFYGEDGKTDQDRRRATGFFDDRA